MDITTTTTSSITANTNNNNNTSIKTPEAESETPTRIQPAKPVSFANGLLKRHHPLSQQPPPQPVFAYKECLKNHAAAIGGHALDGCGEFMSSPTSNPTDPTSLKCAACGCHRNFHRRETEQQSQHNRALIEYQPHHRHHPPPPPADSPSSPSPPPISSSYYPASAPHMLLALSAGLSAQQPEHSPVVGHHATAPIALSNKRKRFRTKFTQQQKEKMLEFAEKAGWKIQKRDDAAIAVLCNEIGVDRGVLKVWMHNNKSTLGKKSDYNNTNNTIEKSSSGSEENMEQHQFHHNNVVVNATNGNGSSTSS